MARLVSFTGEPLRVPLAGAELPAALDTLPVWTHITGLEDTAAIVALGARLKLHPLIVEDICDTTQRAKMEAIDGGVFVIARVVGFDEAGGVRSEQVSFVLTGTRLVSFSERELPFLEGLVAHLRRDPHPGQEPSPVRLAHALLDAVADDYFAVVEHLEDRAEEIHGGLLIDPHDNDLSAIHALRRDVFACHKVIWPLRETLGRLARGDISLLSENDARYFRDVEDHALHVLEMLDSQKDALGSMTEIYLAAADIRLNDVMKVLTIISTVFIPLTFLVGVYGMNFHNMPELDWEYGYPVLWGVMLVLAAVMTWFFKRRHWF